MALFYPHNRPDLGAIEMKAAVGVGRMTEAPEAVQLLVQSPMGILAISMSVDVARLVALALNRAARDCQELSPFDDGMQEEIYT